MHDPFVVLSAILDDYSVSMEEERQIMDERTCRHEARAGVAVTNYEYSIQASINDYAALKIDLHTFDATLILLERMLEFQVELADFLLLQHQKLHSLRCNENVGGHHRNLDIAAYEKVEASLQLSASMSRSRLSQVKTLSKRIHIQLSVVASSIVQNDSLTSIAIAEDTRRDSVAMKTIAALTMVFLPATFVAVCF